jgi:hypothetical protein
VQIPGRLAAALMLVLCVGCAVPGPDSPLSLGPGGVPRFVSELYLLPAEVGDTDLDLRIADRQVVEGTLGEPLLRVRFSFVSYRGYVGIDDVHRSSGALFLPVDARGTANPARFGEVLLTEYPPGVSATGFPLYAEYGERPAIELGWPTAIVDLRGPIARELRYFRNPADSGGSTFTSEEQFALSMLYAFQETADFSLLYEQRVAQAWLRAIRAVDVLLLREIGERRSTFLLAGEGYGALGALQAAAAYPGVRGLVYCGWPLDWPDLHFTRWRRWEREARYYPLEDLQPLPYPDSQSLLSFLFSSQRKPDPGCPTCRAGGDLWTSQFDYHQLKERGLLDHVRTLVLVGDSDPRYPLDLEIRASVPPQAVAELPVHASDRTAPAAASRGPFAQELVLPFAALRYLRASRGTLAHEDAAEGVLAWLQTLSGFRDVPRLRVREALVGGDVELEILVREGNASVSSVEIYLTEIEDADDSDFKHALHRSPPGTMLWRRVDASYGGHTQDFGHRWLGSFPLNRSRNRAYYVIVRDRVGDLATAYSLPIRPLWNLGDPAIGPARF